MSIDNDKIELGAGEPLLLQYDGNEPLFWDDSIYWDNGSNTWPWEAEVGSAVDAEFLGKKLYKDIQVGHVAAAVKSAVIGAEGSMKLKMTESDMSQLVAAMGGNPSLIVTVPGSEKSFTFGGSAKTVAFAMRYTVPQCADRSKHTILELYKGIPQGISTLPFSKTEERLYEVEFKLLGPASANWALGSVEIEL